MRIILTLGLVCLLALLGSPVKVEGCTRLVLSSSPPPITAVVTASRDSVTVWASGAWIETVQATGSMRPAVQDGSRVILIPPEVGLLVPGRVILFYPFSRTDQRVLHRIYAEGVDSAVPALLIGTGTSGWTLAWDGLWYEPGITAPTPPLEARYWITWGDNNCLPDFWPVRYKDVLGVMAGVIE